MPRAKNFRVCPVCGKPFHAPPSSEKVTCSRECEAANRAGNADPHQLAAGRERMQAEERADPASNHMAKAWILRGPDGTVYEVVNLARWVTDSGLFEGQERTAYTQFLHIKQSIEGTRTKGQVWSWHGWTLEGYGDGNYRRRAKPEKICPVCGKIVAGRNGSAVYCSTDCRLKARADRAREEYRREKGETDGQ